MLTRPQCRYFRFIISGIQKKQYWAKTLPCGTPDTIFLRISLWIDAHIHKTLRYQRILLECNLCYLIERLYDIDKNGWVNLLHFHCIFHEIYDPNSWVGIRFRSAMICLRLLMRNLSNSLSILRTIWLDWIRNHSATFHRRGTYFILDAALFIGRSLLRHFSRNSFIVLINNIRYQDIIVIAIEYFIFVSFCISL